jgi:hypothetical protein
VGALGTPWSAERVATPCSRVALVRVASKLAGTSVLDESERQVFVVVEVIQDLVVRITERAISRSLEGSHEDGLQNVFDGQVTNVARGAVECGDRDEMTVDSALGVSIPAHHAGDFAGKQNSLHALVVKRENSEKCFPYLLGTQLLGRAVGVENFHSVGERGPEVLKAAIEDVFKRVTVVLIQCHPGIFFSVVDRKVCRGYKSAGKGAARQNPTKLDAEDQEEAVDMAGKVFMRLDTAAFKCGIVRWKVGFAPGAMTVVIAVGSAARATAESTTSSRSVILAVRHVAAAASKTRKVDTGTTAGEGKSAPVAVITRWASPSGRSAQIRGAVSVHQGSLIH